MGAVVLRIFLAREGIRFNKHLGIDLSIRIVYSKVCA